MDIYNKSQEERMRELTRQKDKRTIPQGELELCKYEEYYDVDNTITSALANPTAPVRLDPENAGYNTEPIFQIIGRNAPKVWVTNDAAAGGATLFVIASIGKGGVTKFSRERPIYPQQYKVYYNVYELRLRSPTQSVPYRVSEFEIGAL